MKALVYLGPQEMALQDRFKRSLVARTAVNVKMARMTMCGTDPHFLNGELPFRLMQPANRTQLRHRDQAAAHPAIRQQAQELQGE